jgi:hypothetical protein
MQGGRNCEKEVNILFMSCFYSKSDFVFLCNKGTESDFILRMSIICMRKLLRRTSWKEWYLKGEGLGEVGASYH